MVYVDTGYTGL